MYLPTFWKLHSEAWFWKVKKMGGWALPASMMSKWITDEPLIIIIRFINQNAGALGRVRTFVCCNSCMDWFPFILQLDLLDDHPSQARCREETIMSYWLSFLNKWLLSPNQATLQTSDLAKEDPYIFASLKSRIKPFYLTEALPFISFFLYS